jgi:hypothetical protein
MGSSCGTHGRGGEEKCTGFLWGMPEGKSPLGRPRRRWEDGFGIDLREHLAQDRDRWRAVVSAVMNRRFLAPLS